MNGFYQGKATILKVTSYEVNDIGEQKPVYTASTKKVDIRIFSSTSQYVRTETGFVKANQWTALVNAKTDVEQGNQITFNGKTYDVVGVDDDGSGVFLSLTLE